MSFSAWPACTTRTTNQDAGAQARQILLDHPEITRLSVCAAAAAADLPRLVAHLAADRRAAARPGGPFRCEPLVDPGLRPPRPRHRRGRGARRRPDAAPGLADPNAGYLWHGLPTPFTVLTGVFGEGELGPVRQPRHPHALALARLLLEAGADPNDGQALYNRMFEPGHDHLELLLEFGLGAGDGGPWQARMGGALDTPETMVRGQLRWAVTHGMAKRVRLLVEHGADIASPFEDGSTPAERAATTGHPELARYLVEHGAPAPELDPGQRFVAAALVADRAAVEELRAAHPGLAEAVRRDRPALIVWAAAQGRPGSAELLAGLGFDVNARGRSDVPAADPWQTALHVAAMDGRLDRARSRRQARCPDPTVREGRFDLPPRSPAPACIGQEQLVTLLEPLTAPEEP